MSAINLNYCAQCKHIDKEHVSNCRWLNFNFCCLKCLQQFHDQIAFKCDLCEKQLNYHRIHLRDDVKNQQLFTFVCDECFVQRKSLAVYCYCCGNKCYKGFGTLELATSGLISKYVCSDECKIAVSLKKYGGKKRNLVSCSECGVQEKCIRFVQNGECLSICSSTSLAKVEECQPTKIGLFFFRFYYSFIWFYFAWIFFHNVLTEKLRKNYWKMATSCSST